MKKTRSSEIGGFCRQSYPVAPLHLVHTLTVPEVGHMHRALVPTPAQVASPLGLEA